jgi:hypothetical protein
MQKILYNGNWIPYNRKVAINYQGNSFPNISGKANSGEILMICIDNGSANGFAIQTTSNGSYSIDWGDGTIETGTSTAFTTQTAGNNLTAQVSHTHVENNGSGLGVWIPEWKVWAYTVRIYNASSPIKYFKVAKTSAKYTIQNNCVAWAEINVPSLVNISQMWSNGVAISPLRSPFLKKVNIYDTSNVTSSDYFAYECFSFDDYNFPAMPLATSRTYAMYGTGIINSSAGAFYNGASNCSMTYFLANMLKLRTFTFTGNDWGSVSSTAYMFDGDSAIDEIYLPAGVGNNKNTDCTNTFNNCNNVTLITNLQYLGSTISSCNFTNVFGRCEKLAQSLTINAKLSKISLGGSSTVLLPITGLRLLNTASTFGGSAPHCDVSYCNFDANALNQTATDLVAGGYFAGKTYKVTGCPGAGSFNQSIITNGGGIVQN